MNSFSLTSLQCCDILSSVKYEFRVNTYRKQGFFLFAVFILEEDMWSLFWPILLVICANTFYNISAKSTPVAINAFASLSITYLVASILSLMLFFKTGTQKNLLVEISKANWTSLVLGIAVVALEFGYISIYRAGWKISIASLVANIALACVLLTVGLLIYKETISLRQVCGMLICALGLFLIRK